MSDHVTLSRVSEDDQYDFASLYSEYITHIDDEIEDTPILDMEQSKYYSPSEFSQLAGQRGHNALSAFCVNCQSLNGHWDGIINLLSELNSESHSLDLVGLTEIFKINDYTNYSISGYHPIVYKTRLDGNRGGVGLYISESMNYTTRGLSP